jgi:hypothetical protein
LHILYYYTSRAEVYDAENIFLKGKTGYGSLMESFEKFSFQMQKINFVLELHAIFLSKEASCPPTRSSHKNSSILYFLKTILARLEWRMRRGGGGGG